MYLSFFFFECIDSHLDLHVLTHHFPTRRSSELEAAGVAVVVLDQAAQNGFVGFAFGAAHRTVPRFDLAQFALFGVRGDALELDHGHVAASAEGVFRIRSEEHTSELQSLMRISYAVFCLKKKKQTVERNQS